MNIGIDGRILEWKYSGIARYVNLLLSFDTFAGATVYFPGKSTVHLGDKFKKKCLKNPFKRRELYEQTILPFHLAKDKIDLFIQPYNFGIPILFFGKSILIVFDIIPLLFKDYFFYARHKKWAKWNYEKNSELALSKATKIVSDSESAKQDILKYFPKLNSDKIVPIYYGFKKDENVLSANFNKFLKNKGIGGDYVLAPAGLEERKNAHLLILAFSKFLQKSPRRIQLVFTGYSKHYLEKLHALCLSEKLERSVIFADYVTEDEKNFLMQNAKLIVNPSSFEGFGIPLLEAATANKSIIVSDIPVFKEVGGDYPIFFENNNLDDLVEKISYFFNNEQEENEKALTLKNQFLERFALKKMEENWNILLKDI